MQNKVMRFRFINGLRNKRSFTLTEVLLTIIVLSVGVLGIVQAWSTALYSFKDTENVKLALNIAQAKMEEIKNIGFTVEDSSDPDPVFPTFTTTVDVSENPAGLKQVDATVSWPAKGGGEARITLTTLITDHQ